MWINCFELGKIYELVNDKFIEKYDYNVSKDKMYSFLNIYDENNFVLGTPMEGYLRYSVNSVDLLYQKAYEAVVSATSNKNQKSINEARAAIEALRGTGAEWAIGEFSKNVDKVQHPILVNIINSINNAQSSLKQADINNAKAAIDLELPEIWRNSYSSAVDIIQQKLMKNALDAIEKANKSGLRADIDAAKALIEDIKTANDSSISSWACTVNNNLIKYPLNNYTRFYNGIIVSPGNGNDSVRITVDRSNLPDSMKNFNKMSVIGHFFSVSKAIEDSLINGVHDYNEEIGYSSGEYSTDFATLVVLYDNNTNPLGYYILNPKEYNVGEFTTGITITSNNKANSYNLKVDKDSLPVGMKNFTKIEVSTTNFQWDDIAISECIREAIYTGNRSSDYNPETGYDFGLINGANSALITLYDDNMNPLGYYKTIVQ